MNTRFLILGSGKMAKDIGSFFLKNGCRVSWATRSEERIPKMEKYIERIARRIFGKPSDIVLSDRASVHLLQDKTIERPDTIIESTEEILSVKKEAIESVRRIIDGNVRLFSNSSSFLPTQIDENCIGTHFFYPIEPTRFLEIILPVHCKNKTRKLLIEWAGKFNLHFQIQKDNNAFLANRLLLPLQAEAVRAIQNGFDPDFIDSCSKTSCFQMGQLSLMDSIGLDTVFCSIQNYTSRISEKQAGDYKALLTALSQMLDSGKKGNKVNDGFLCGADTPWPKREIEQKHKAQFEELFTALFLNSCATAIERGQAEIRDIDQILERVAQSKYSFTQLEHQGKKYKSLLNRLHNQTGLSYFRSSSARSQKG